jgi:hypothetical protein
MITNKTKLLSSIVFVVMLAALWGVASADDSVTAKLFHAETKSFRALRIFLVFNDNVNLHNALKLIEKASYYAEKDVGIKLRIVRTMPVGGDTEYGNLSLHAGLSLGQIQTLTWKHKKEFDIAIGFANDPPVTRWAGWFLQKPFGVIEDEWRRYIILYDALSYKIILHEIYHAFVLRYGHSSKILNSPWPTSSWLHKDDRKEVLENKWRDFNVRPEIPSEFVQDLPHHRKEK